MLLFVLTSCKKPEEQKDNKDIEIKINEVIKLLKEQYGTFIETDKDIYLVMRFEQYQEVEITWHSNKEDVISNEGKINRKEEHMLAILTASVKYQNKTSQFIINVIVLGIEIEETPEPIKISGDMNVKDAYECILTFNKLKDENGNYISNDYYYVSGYIVGTLNGNQAIIYSDGYYLLIHNADLDQFVSGSTTKITFRYGFIKHEPALFYNASKSERMDPETLIQAPNDPFETTINEILSNVYFEKNILFVTFNGLLVGTAVSDDEGNQILIGFFEDDIYADLQNRMVIFTGYIVFDKELQTWQVVSGFSLELQPPFCPVC